MLTVVMLNITYAECRYAKYRYVERGYAECRYTECRYTERRGTSHQYHWLAMKTDAKEQIIDASSQRLETVLPSSLQNKLERLSLANISSLV